MGREEKGEEETEVTWWRKRMTAEAEVAAVGPQPGAIWGHQEMEEARSGFLLGWACTVPLP